MKKNQEKTKHLVAICGRTNVGKSTLFNRLTEKSQALVSNIAGTTRDSNLGTGTWNHLDFDIVDTAGLVEENVLEKDSSKEKDINRQSQKQALKYLKQADLILFVVDSKNGLLPEDKAIASLIRKNPTNREKCLLVANKVDNFRQAGETAQFNQLALGEPQIISAASGLGTGDLLDVVIDRLKKLPLNISEKKEIDEEETINVCIIGKPNVGKSSLLNSILGYERVIVSPVAHTTREPQDTIIDYDGKKIKIIDTAGISKHGQKTKNGLEKPGIQKTLAVLGKSQIALLVLDMSESLTHQDAKLVQEIFDRQKSLIIIANKWDIVEVRDTKKWTQVINDKLPFASWAPIQFVSAKSGEKVKKIMDLIVKVAEDRHLSLSASQCEKFMKAVVKIHKPAKGKGIKAPRIYEFRQTKDNPPSFLVRIGQDDDLHFSYLRFMENRLRERHSFLGTPIRIKIEKNKKSHTTTRK
jgi:GTP-binding protein